MDNKISNIKERILKIAEKKGISKEKFFQEIGMTYGSFKGVQKNTALNSDALEKIISIYPDIDCEWLLTGNGEMFKKDHHYDNILNEESENDYKKSTQKDIRISYLEGQVDLLKELLLKREKQNTAVSRKKTA
jgi:hypothetical protein